MIKKCTSLRSVLALMLIFTLVINTIVQESSSANPTVVRYEAQNATRSGGGSNPPTVTSSTLASGGQYVQTKDGDLTFTVSAATSGFYTVWVNYSQTYGDTKTQNLVVNAQATGSTDFARTGDSLKFQRIVLLQKVRLNSGSNTIKIEKSWGWVDIDYIEVGEFTATSFDLPSAPVNPNASANSKKMYSFIKDNFQKKVISGVMTGDIVGVSSLNNQKDVAFVRSSSGNKTPALVGFDFMHGTGINSEGSWYKDYNNGILNFAEELYNRGGIPIFAWHWKDPSLTVESFYSNETTFDANAVFNTGTANYNAIIRDIDIVAGYLKKLADKDIPVLWRPLHEAAGGWFWWGAKGAAANKALWILMYDRLVNHHKLNNLIWVWTCEENANALEWYPGDQYVDVVGRDFYYYPTQKNHGSLMSSFENLKELYGRKKIITLSENGSIPYPENLVADGAGWSWFMPWYNEHAGSNGNSNHNTASDWNRVMNHDYVLTLEDMPGWGGYVTPPVTTTTTPLTTTTPPTSTSTPTTTTPPPIVAGMIYDMQAIPTADFTSLTGLGGAPSATLNLVLRRNGGSATEFTAIDGSPRKVTVTSRGGTSQGLRIWANNVVALPGFSAGKTYTIEVTGRFTGTFAGVQARIRDESNNTNAWFAAPNQSNGTFTVIATQTGSQIQTVAGATNSYYSIGCNGSAPFSDMEITGVVIKEFGGTVTTTTPTPTTTTPPVTTTTPIPTTTTPPVTTTTPIPTTTTPIPTTTTPIPTTTPPVTTTTPPPEPTCPDCQEVICVCFQLGYVLGNSSIGIVDAVEILKYLAGLDSIIKPGNSAWKASLIVGGLQPTISDAIEILKLIAKFPSLLN